MKFSKLLSNTLITGLTVFGSSVLIPAEKVSAAACPDPSRAGGITSLEDGGDPNSFFQLTLEEGPDDGGFCEGTPEEYGVTVYKMGFCETDPGNPTGNSALSGVAPGYESSKCTWSYQNNNGEAASFGAGATFNLSDTYASKPAAGRYRYAAILIEKDFKIKAKYGPIGPEDGIRTTYYTTSEHLVSASTTNGSAPANWAASTAPLNSFDPGESCEGSFPSFDVAGGSISAYLLNTTGQIIPDDDDVETCTGVDKLLGVMRMDNIVTITENTKSLKATFVVTNNGTTVMLDQANNQLDFDSGPFSVSFEVIE